MASTNRSHEQYAQFLTMGPLATIAVAARLVARAKSNVSFGLDDVFAVLALAFYWTYIGVSLWGESASLRFDCVIYVVDGYD